jgi:hypothetical protein
VRPAIVLAVPILAIAADPITLVLPQTLHQPIGATTALRSGASVAFGDEAAATWYDPALAAVLDPGQLSAGATAYGFNRIDLQAGQDSDALLSGAVLKVYGGLSGRCADGEVGWAVLFANPLHWSGAVDAGHSEPTPGRRSYASHVRVDQDTWSGQAAFGINPADSTQLGLALVGNYDTIDLNQSLWARDDQGNFASSDLVTSAWSASMQMRIGLRYAPPDGLVAAVAITTPALELMHGGLVSYSTLVSSPTAGNSTSTDARTEDDAFRFVHPWQVILAGGWRGEGWDSELDLVWSLPEPIHETIPTLNGVELRTSGGLTTSTPMQRDARYTGYRNVLNARIGGSTRISDRVQLHAGAFTDISPIASSDIYNQIDIYGVSGGISFKRGEGAIVLGVSASYGAEDLGVYDPSTDSLVDARIEVFSMDFLIGTMAKF